MAIFHHSIKIISRGKGKSAVAAAAYRSGETITNEYDGITHDYTRKGGIVHTEILLPDNAPIEYLDRATLWNAVEKCERAQNAQLAREIEIALPIELSREQNIELVRGYVSDNFTAKGMCADICVHDKKDGNPHAHIMLTVRPMDRQGAWAAKSKKEYITDENGERIRLTNGNFKTRKINTTDWNEQSKAEQWRQAWAMSVNAELEKQNVTESIDHRSYKRQGIEQIPTVHMGVAAVQMERRGIRTKRGDVNREIELTNRELRQLKARITKLQKWLKDEAGNTKPPTLADVIQSILSKREGQNRYQSIANLKSAADMLNFLTTNKIKDMADLEEKTKVMYGKRTAIGERLKPIERRLKTLDEHIKHADAYMKYRETSTQYRQQKPKKQEAFYEAHRFELIHFEAAERYLKAVINGKTAIPTKAWKSERDKLSAESNSLFREYETLKAEVKQMEQIRKRVGEIMRIEQRKEQPTHNHNMER